MILHIFPDEKFTLDYINRIDRIFGINNHFFVIYGHNIQLNNYACFQSTEHFLYYNPDKDSIESLRKIIVNSERIVLHSLPSYSNILICLYDCFCVRENNSVLFWGVWGSDLYNDCRLHHSSKVLTHPQYLYKEYIRKKIIARMDFIISSCDYELVKKLYKTNARQLKAVYSFNFYDYKIEENSKPIVLVGHSATKTCRHLETFSMLEKYKDKIMVVCPLSYPKDQKSINYREKVILIGKQKFKDSFKPITDFMNYKEYTQFLCNVDIGVFNNDRQQGMGNITNLLYYGKKVYLSEDNTISKVYHSPDYTIFSCNDIAEESFLSPLSEGEIKKIKLES